MITVDDIKRAVLISTKAEFERQLSALSSLTAIDLATYRKVLDMIDAAKQDLPEIEWIQDRLTRARDAAVSGYAYR